ncbi:MAG TPA: phospho-N-acetylmuramoyl-pentapeptide-transferase [Firmicutes bacterium]|nr:phospho-N-acetylmuramoyl-pentapeptide-transferase [Bacillota bacterium]
MKTEIRLLLAALSALVLGLAIGPVILPALRRLKIRQTVREDGPATHLKKSGVPTMGGIIFLISLVVVAFIFVPAHQRMLAATWLWLVLGLGVIGFLDDYIKVVRRQSLGLRAREKLLGQLIVAVVFYGMLKYLGHSFDLIVPIWGWRLAFDWLYLPFVILIIMAAGNGANLTDGVDGLLASSVIVSCLAYVFIGLATGLEVIAVLMATLVGALLAYLRFNWHPAEVIMGDVGSLALGGAMAGAAILTKTELLLVPIGIVFVIETLSLIIQVVYFRRTGGKRFFRMAPIHHHFELGGWSEVKVVSVWCLLSIIGGIVGLLLLPSMGL